MKRTINELLKQCNRCLYCNQELGPNGTWEHLIPRVHGGYGLRGNLVRVCRRCNSRKGRLDLFSAVIINGWDLERILTFLQSRSSWSKFELELARYYKHLNRGRFK